MDKILTKNNSILIADGDVLTIEQSSGGGSANLQSSKSYTVVASGSQTISPDSGYDGMEEVALSVPAGTAGTPTATKGTVSSNSISVTPSVTNTAGWVSSETKTGTAVTVSANELVSGTKSITANGTDIDVTNYAAVDVNVGGYFTVTDTTDTAGGTIRTITPTAGTPVVQSGRTVEITENGTTTIQPSSGCTAMSDVEVTVDVAGSSSGSIIPSGLPNDGATRLGYYIDEDTPSTRMTAYIHCTPSVATGVTIDWGDGSTTTTDTTSEKTYSHTYTAIPQNGYYIQKISCTSGTVSFIGSGSGNYYTIYGTYAYVFGSGSMNTVGDARIRWAVIGTDCVSCGSYCFAFARKLQEVEFKGATTTLGTYAFYYCSGLEKIILPSSLTSIPDYCFRDCSALHSISFPSTTVTLGNYALQDCLSLNKIDLGSISSISYAALNSCFNLLKLDIPSTVTSIGNYALQGLSSLAQVIFRRATPPTIEASGAWQGLRSDCIFIVPYSSLFDYAYGPATNYPTNPPYIYYGFGTFGNGATLPEYDNDDFPYYILTWYATIEDCIAGTNPLSVGNGNEIYCTGSLD